MPHEKTSKLPSGNCTQDVKELCILQQRHHVATNARKKAIAACASTGPHMMIFMKRASSF